MSAFMVELPVELKAEVARRAGGVPGGEAALEKLAACAELEYLEGRAAKGSRKADERALGRVPATAPVPGDERE